MYQKGKSGDLNLNSKDLEAYKLKDERMQVKSLIKNGKLEVDPDSAARNLTEREAELMSQFKENDEEIDAVLDIIIAGVHRLHNHALNIGTAIEHQKHALKKTNKGAQKARK